MRSRIAWWRARARFTGVLATGLLAFWRAMRTVTVKEIRVRVESGVPGGLGLQGAQCLVDGEEREHFLADQLG